MEEEKATAKLDTCGRFKGGGHITRPRTMTLMRWWGRWGDKA